MNITQIIDKYGARQTARMLINSRIKSQTYGLVTIADMPDTLDICQLTDELEDVLSSDLIDENSIRTILENINDDFLMENICS